MEVVSTSLTLGVERFLPRAASRLYYALCQKRAKHIFEGIPAGKARTAAYF